MMKIVATTSLPAVNRPNANHWNAAHSCQKSAQEIRVLQNQMTIHVDYPWLVDWLYIEAQYPELSYYEVILPNFVPKRGIL